MEGQRLILNQPFNQLVKVPMESILGGIIQNIDFNLKIIYN